MNKFKVIRTDKLSSNTEIVKELLKYLEDGYEIITATPLYSNAYAVEYILKKEV